jgi:transcriptional regulator with XRE-family HTH domain
MTSGESEGRPTVPMLGERVRTMRHFRHKTLDEIAGLAGISSSYLSMLERGLRPLDSRRLLYRLADVLVCSVADLTGEPVPATSTSHAAALATVQDIRVAIASSRFHQADSVIRDVDLLSRDADDALRLYMDCRYAECGRRLAQLIADLSLASDSAVPGILGARTQAFFTTWSLMTSLGFLDLALRAAEIASEAAGVADDPVLLGAAGFAHAQALDRIGASRASLDICLRTAEQIEAMGQVTSGVLQVCGTLHLHAAQTCAILGDRDETEAHLAEAQKLASRTGEHTGRSGPDANVFHLYFGPANVELWKLAIAVEMHEGGRAPQIVERIDLDALRNPNRRAYMYADLGRGLAQQRSRDREAVAALCDAERTAPDLIRATPLVRETVTDLLRRARRRAGGRDLAGLAYRIGVMHKANQ